MTLSAINYKRLELLESLTNNHLQAKLLDRFVYWWQHSKYTLNDNQKWFTRSVQKISESTSISERSIARYMKKFEQLGLIERRCVLLRKKNLYIRITEKLLNLLKSDTILTTTGSIKTDSLAVSYIRNKEQIVKTNSTISDDCIVNNSDELIKNTSHTAQTESQDNSGYKIEKEIGERITTRFKNYIKGVITNLQEQYSLKFSNPEKLFAEIVFAATNKENHFSKIDNAHHRVNIIAKLIREKRWRTPKGFYNHWDVGQLFKEREDVKQRKQQARKQEEGVDATSIAHESNVQPSYTKTSPVNNSDKRAKQKRASERRELEIEIKAQEKYLNQLEQWLKEGRAGISQAVIDSCALGVAGLSKKLTELYSA